MSGLELWQSLGVALAIALARDLPVAVSAGLVAGAVLLVLIAYYGVWVPQRIW